MTNGHIDRGVPAGTVPQPASQVAGHGVTAASGPRWRANLHVYFSALQFETRVLKVTRSLVDQGFVRDIEIVGVWEPGLARHEVLDPRRRLRRLRLWVPRVMDNRLVQLLRVAEFSARVLFHAVRRRVDLVNCHMLLLLPVCVGMRKLLGAQLVYEPHEFESEPPGASERQKRILKWVEKRLVRHADLVVHVGRAVAQWYEQAYGIPKVQVLNNTPYAREIKSIASKRILRERFGLGADELVFIYQGQLIENRGVMLMLEVFAACADKSRHLVVMGFGPCQPAVEEAARVHANIHFLPAVPPDRIIEHTAGADVGISIRLGSRPDNNFANPNKMNEYFLAGIPMIVNDLPEPARFVRERECGWIMDGSGGALAALVAGITRAEVSRLQEQIARTRGSYGWEREEAAMRQMYDELGAKRKR